MDVTVAKVFLCVYDMLLLLAVFGYVLKFNRDKSRDSKMGFVVQFIFWVLYTLSIITLLGAV